MSLFEGDVDKFPRKSVFISSLFLSCSRAMPSILDGMTMTQYAMKSSGVTRAMINGTLSTFSSNSASVKTVNKAEINK